MFSEYRWWLTGSSLFQQIKLIKPDWNSILAIRNNSEIAYYSEMPIPSGSTSASDKLYAVCG